MLDYKDSDSYRQSVSDNRMIICDCCLFIQNDDVFDMQFEYGPDILIPYAFFMASISD